MNREQELIKQAEQLALLPASEKPLDKLKKLLKDEADHNMASRVVTFFYITLEETLFGKDQNALLHQAVRLINTYPLPDDAENQLNKLIKSAKTEAEKMELSSMTEALFLVRHS